MARLAATVSEEALGEKLGDVIGAYIEAWNEPEHAPREELLRRCWADDGLFKDAWSHVRGLHALNQHIEGARAMTGGARLERSSEIDQSHDFVRFGWHVLDAEGAASMAGTNVGRLGPDGRFRVLVGFQEGEG